MTMTPNNPQLINVIQQRPTEFWIEIWVGPTGTFIKMLGTDISIDSTIGGPSYPVVCRCGWFVATSLSEDDALYTGYQHWDISHGGVIPWGPHKIPTKSPSGVYRANKFSQGGFVNGGVIPRPPGSGAYPKPAPVLRVPALSASSAVEEPAYEGTVEYFDDETVEKLALVIAIDGEHEDVITSADRELAREIMRSLGLVHGDPYTYAVTNPHDERKHVFPTLSEAMKNCVRIREEFIVRKLGAQGKWEKYVPLPWREWDASRKQEN